MKRAFTLIELLVVIAIIAILAAILFPVFAQAKESAKKAALISNFNQIGKGVALYTNDYDDLFPIRQISADNGDGLPPRATWAPITWREIVSPYIKNGVRNTADVMLAGQGTGPSADRGVWEVHQRPGIYGVIDMHEAFGTGIPLGKAPSQYAPISQTQLDRVAEAAMIMEKGVNPDWNSPGRGFEMNWWGYQAEGYVWPPPLKGGGNVMEGDRRDWPYWAIPRYRQQGVSTIVTYADYHVKAVRKGINWCRSIHIAGMDPGQEWVYQPGNPCDGEQP